jgi:hypothetical protein
MGHNNPPGLVQGFYDVIIKGTFEGIFPVLFQLRFAGCADDNSIVRR